VREHSASRVTMTDYVKAAGDSIGDTAVKAKDKVCDCADAMKRAVQATFVAGAEDGKHFVDDSTTALSGAAEAAYHKVEIALPALVLIVWVASTVALTYLTKWALAGEESRHPGAGFSFPVFYTLVTTFAALLGCIIILLIQGKAGGLSFAQFKQSWKEIVAVSVLFIIGIWASDASLMYISVTLNQILKATTPFPTMIFAYLVEKKTFVWPMVVAVTLIVVGACMAVPFDSPDATPFGLTMAAIATVAAACCITLKGRLMANSKENGLTPLVLLFYTSTAGMPVLIIWFLCSKEEREGVPEFIERDPQLALLQVLLPAACLAFTVNLLGNTLTKVTSALTVTIVGSAKQITIIVVSAVFIDHTFKNALNWCGAIIFLLSLIAYAVMSFNKKLAPKQMPIVKLKSAVKYTIAAAHAAKGDISSGANSIAKAALGAVAHERTPLKPQEP